MPSKSWMLARAASRAATEARKAAAAAAASRGSAVAAADSRGGVNRPPTRYTPRTPRTSPASPAPPSSYPSNHDEEEAYLPIQEAYRVFRKYRGRPGQTKKPFDVKDLESDETLWALYNRWCTYFNVARSSVDKSYRFDIFKEKARLIYKLKGADPKNLELNHLSDVDLDELCTPKFFRRRY